MGTSELMILLLALGGGDGNEMLNYLPTQPYWKIKGVEVSAGTMLAELAPHPKADASALVPRLGADSFEAREKASAEIRAIGPDALPALRKALESESAEIRNRANTLIRELAGGTRHREIRRLMAIRTLGELRALEAETALRPLLESAEPFVAAYARTALASIRGQKADATAAPGGADRDLALLPAGLGVVGRMTWSPGQPVDYGKLLKTLTGLPLPGDQTPDQMAEQAAGQMVAIAERIGNIRIDAVTVGVSADMDGRTGFVTAVVRGRYDAKAIRDLIRQEAGVEPREVEGMEILPLDRQAALLLPSDDLLLLAVGPEERALPLAELAATLRAGGAKPVSPEVAALAKAVDTTRPLWISLRMNEAFRRLPIASPFETVTLTSETKDAMQALTLKAAGQDPEAVKTAVGIFEKGLEEARAEIGQAIAQAKMPQMQSFADLLNSIDVKAEGAVVTVTGTMKAEGASAVGVAPFLLLTAKGARVEAQAMPPQPQRPVEARPRRVPQPPPPPPRPE